MRTLTGSLFRNGCRPPESTIWRLVQVSLATGSKENTWALFCAFNENGVENRAHCYFKDISGKVADDFYLEVQ